VPAPGKGKILRRILPVLVVLVIFAGVLGVRASFGSSTPSRPAAVPVADLATLLNDGVGDTAPDYFKPTSWSLVAAAAGDYNSRFYDLGALLVQDGFSNTILDLGREMNGTWYEWSEHRAPSSEPNAYTLAWQQIVTTMRSVPGQHFKFLWTIYPVNASIADAWPGSAYVDYIGTDIFDWHGITSDYPLTAADDLDWFGGQDDPLFITNMMAWLKANHAIGLYWAGEHVTPVTAASGPLLANQGASAQVNTPNTVNALGKLMGGRLQYAGVYLPDGQPVLNSVAEPVLAPWVHAGYQLILSVPIVPNPSFIKSYSGPPEPGNRPYQLADYPDAVAALRNGVTRDRPKLPMLVPWTPGWRPGK